MFNDLGLDRRHIFRRKYGGAQKDRAKSIGHQLISPAGTMASAPLALMQRRYIYRAAIQRSAEIASQAFGE
jgi:hypothetical protein